MTLSYTQEQKSLQQSLEGTNISAVSFLATDYLNHYNEIVMLLDMVADMPEIIDETSNWQPRTYVDHFKFSGFQQKDLAVKAYEMAPKTVLKRFNMVCSGLDHEILCLLQALDTLHISTRGLSAKARDLLIEKVSMIQKKLMQLNHVIHGTDPYFSKVEAQETSDNVQTQADIDKIFD